jgi:hypothetical protein
VGARRQIAAELLRRQAEWCGRLGSPLYHGLLTSAAGDCEAGGPVWTVLDGHEGEPEASALALRLLGAVHRLVLDGEGSALARHYPSAGGTTGGDPWPDFVALVAERAARLRTLVVDPVQTNEVGRSVALLGGFLTVADETGLPLRVLEVGASAGLNLRWDHYRYESRGAGFGDAASPVRFVDAFPGAQPRLDVEVRIAERAGCDARTVDPSSATGRATLRSYVWPDQEERLARLDGALAIAARIPARLDRADLVEWLSGELARPMPGTATVVFHSIVLQYLGRERAAVFRELLRAHGAAATAAAPLAWLRLEPARTTSGDLEYRVELTSWPSGTTRLLAVSSPHGPPVHWVGG